MFDKTNLPWVGGRLIPRDAPSFGCCHALARAARATRARGLSMLERMVGGRGQWQACPGVVRILPRERPTASPCNSAR